MGMNTNHYSEEKARGFTRRNLFRMRQFYEAYVEDLIVSPLGHNYLGPTTSSSWARASARKSGSSMYEWLYRRSGASESLSVNLRPLSLNGWF